MKRILLIGSLLLFFIVAKAQSPLFLEGDKRVNLGFGLSKYPIGSISLDYGVADGILDIGSFGIGPYIAVGSGSNYLYLSLGARGTFHYPIVEDLDTYVGLGVGLRYDVSSELKNKLSPIPGFFLGANYPISKDVLVFGEVGSGVSYITVGISIVFD